MKKRKIIVLGIIVIVIIIISYLVYILFLNNPSNFNNLLERIAKSESNTETILECKYNNQTVYYVIPGCCDIMTSLYSQEGKLICHPSGGKPGVDGDGKCLDFSSYILGSKPNCKNAWGKVVYFE